MTDAKRFGVRDRGRALKKRSCIGTGALLSEQRDLNPRPTAPKAAALAKLRYAPYHGREANVTDRQIVCQKKISLRQA